MSYIDDYYDNIDRMEERRRNERRLELEEFFKNKTESDIIKFLVNDYISREVYSSK